jgi:ASCH domain
LGSNASVKAAITAQAFWPGRRAMWGPQVLPRTIPRSSRIVSQAENGPQEYLQTLPLVLAAVIRYRRYSDDTFMRALSIRQPFAELILRGIKTVEYRSRPTRIIGERFYIYASKRSVVSGQLSVAGRQGFAGL